MKKVKYEEFVPPITNGKVIKVYDGDTITIASKMPWKRVDPTTFAAGSTF